jgi:hypothetical protein
MSSGSISIVVHRRLLVIGVILVLENHLGTPWISADENNKSWAEEAEWVE